MTTCQLVALAAAVLASADAAVAQPPVRPVETPRSDPSRSVTLSLTEYNRLLDLASRPAGPPQSAPVPAVLASAEVRVRVDRDAASGVYTLAGDVLRAGIARVNLIAGATLTDASLDGRPLPLISDGSAHAAFVAGPGPFSASLAWGSPLTFAPGRASFVLPVPPSGTARATIDLPGEQADVHVSAGVVTRRAFTNGRTAVDVTLRPNTPTEIWWSMRDSATAAAARDVRMLADVFTLVTLGDSDVRMAALVDATVVQGEPRTIALRLPAGYDLTGIAGSTIDASEPRENGVVLTVTNPAARRLQFLVTLERAHAGGSFEAATEFIALPDMQRERGEIAIEGVGTLELQAAERAGLHRIDVREVNGALQGLARLPLLAAYRYQRTAGAAIGMTMNVERFPDAGVLAAVADRATATTLITTEGRALTEVSLVVRNRAQPFLKVSLPAAATIVSVEVGGEPAKPVVGSDGTRVPLLRSGFRPNGPYTVSYVYVIDGRPFAKKGELPMALPKMDIPVGIVEWEMFVPDSYKAETVGGNVIEHAVAASELAADQSGTSPVAASRPGASRQRYDGKEDKPLAEPSQNVLNLQKRAAGVLPIRIEVPRAGTAHHFVKPLVIDQEATVLLRYRRR